MAARLDDPVYTAVIDTYFTGLALVAKSDLNLNFAPQACERFAACLLASMRHFGDWDGTDQGLSSGISGIVPFLRAQDAQELLALVEHLRRQPLDPIGLSLERAAILKLFCDAYLIRHFKTMAQAGAASLDGLP
jgi:hypothetical protein